MKRCMTLIALAGSTMAFAGDVPTFTAYPTTNQIIDISDDGASFISTGINLSYWTNGVEMPIGDANTSTITAISGDGTTVIGTVKDDASLQYAGRWTMDNGWENLGDLGLGGCDFNRSSGYNCSDDGSVVVGLAWDNCTGLAFVYTDENGMQALPNSGGGSARANAISDNDVVAGWNGSCRKAAFWDDFGAFETMPGGGVICGEFYDILDDGSLIVGENDFEAVYWTEDLGLVGLGILDNGVGTRAFGVSDDGSIIVGQSGDFFNGYKAVMWTEETGLVDLREYIVGLGANGVPLLSWANSVAVTDTEIIITGASGDPPFTQGYTVSIPLAGGCYADCDGNGELNILDFVCYQNAFTAGDDAADCDANDELNILDFVCYQNAFTAGCN